MSLAIATERPAQARWVLWMSTLAFTVCFAVWTMYAILGLAIQDELALSASQFGSLIAVPVLVGSLTRLPAGMLTDRFGGRLIFTVLLALVSVPTFAVAYARTYWQFLLCGAGFGLAGAGFAVGAAYVSVWTPRERQGTALGIFGVGNVGSAFTSFALPLLLVTLPDWRLVPQIYAGLLLLTALLFYLTTYDDQATHTRGLTLGERLRPLTRIRVWRFGLYYFVVFGSFVALGSWLPNYYKNVYGLSMEQIALITMAFLLPGSLIRAFGGWLSDRQGARQVMYGVLGVFVLGTTLLSLPPGEYTALSLPYRYQPSGGPAIAYTLVANKARHTVTAKVIQVGEAHGEAALAALAASPALAREVRAYLDRVCTGQSTPAFSRKTVAMRLNVWVFTAILFVVGVALGIGKAAVYRYIPDYFPREVGAVGGIVGMLGGLGGFVLPILWGFLLDWTGLYPVAIFSSLAVLGLVSLVWLHYVVKRFMVPREARLAAAFEEVHA